MAAVIFSTRSDQASVAAGADATAGIFSAEMGSSPGRGRGRFRDEARSSRWTIAVRHRAGSLDIAVAHARTRNLVASLVLVGAARWHGLGAGPIYGALAAAGGNAVSFRGRSFARSADSAHRHPRRRLQPGRRSGEGAGGDRTLRQAHPPKRRRTHLDDRERPGIFRFPAFGQAGTARGFCDRRSAGTCRRGHGAGNRAGRLPHRIDRCPESAPRWRAIRSRSSWSFAT